MLNIKVWSVVLAFMLMQVTWAAKLSEAQRREGIIKLIDEELVEARRLSEQYSHKDPDVILRMAELFMEKARMVREDENDKYLSIPPETRRNATKASYFKESSRLFSTANKYASEITKRFPKYSKLGDVYYVMAYNSKEIGDYDKAQKYFQVATRSSRKGSETYHKSQLALADSYYNKNDFSKAIPLYESALSKLDETWWTKDSFNLAWCYYRVKKYDSAIKLMRIIHKRSKNSKYVDMSNYVERDIGLFYVDARRSDEAIEFYRSIGIDFSGQLLFVAKSIIKQGHFTQAESLLNEALRMQKDPQRKTDILMVQLDLYDKFNKVTKHLKTARALTEVAIAKKLQPAELNVLEYQISKKAAELQKTVAGDVYSNVPKTRRLKARQSVEYFALLAKVKPNREAEAAFYQGETWYSISDWLPALRSYLVSYDSAVENKDQKYIKPAMEGMLASLGQRGLTVKQAEEFYIPVYTRYLKVDKRSERAVSIYKKLYKVHLDRKDLIGAEAVLKDFAQNHPNDFKTQEAMLAGIMEEYRKKKDFPAIKGYVAQINQGDYKVSKKYADTLRALMTKLQIEDVQQSLEKGDKSTALRGYIRIYNDKESTPRAKANAAYNLAVLYYELGEASDSYKWSVVALQEMDTTDVKGFSDTFLTIATNLFLRQRFAQSADLSQRVLAKLCKVGASSKEIAFKNSVFLWLAEKKLTEAEGLVTLGEQCGISTPILAEGRLELAKEYSASSRWEKLSMVLPAVAQSPRHVSHTIGYWGELRDAYARAGDNASAEEAQATLLKHYQTAKTQKQEIPVDGLDTVADILVGRLVVKTQQIENDRLSFPEANFNAGVKRKLAALDALTASINEIQQTGSGRGIVKAYRYLIAAYETFANELATFSPEGKSEEYITSFRKAMGTVTGPLMQNVQRQRSEMRSLIESNSILSDDNFIVLKIQEEGLIKRYPKSENFVLMDRGGVR